MPQALTWVQALVAAFQVACCTWPTMPEIARVRTGGTLASGGSLPAIMVPAATSKVPLTGIGGLVQVPIISPVAALCSMTLALWGMPSLLEKRRKECTDPVP